MNIMSLFMKYHWRPPPHKYDIIYMEKMLSHFYLLDVVLNLWNCFLPQDFGDLNSTPQRQHLSPTSWVGDHCGWHDQL